MFCNTWTEAFKNHDNNEKIFRMQLPNGLLRAKFKACTKSDIQLHFLLLRIFFSNHKLTLQLVVSLNQVHVKKVNAYWHENNENIF